MTKPTIEPVFDETQPHPFRDPLNKDGILMVDTSINPITVRNPIYRRWANGSDSGKVVDWKATALSLADRLYERAVLHDACERALALADETAKSKTAMCARLANRNEALQDILFIVRNRWWFKLFASLNAKAVIDTKLFKAN